MNGDDIIIFAELEPVIWSVREYDGVCFSPQGTG
jgi:hypothetical protein